VTAAPVGVPAVPVAHPGGAFADRAVSDLATEVRSVVARFRRRVRAEGTGEELSDTEAFVLDHLVGHGQCSLRELSGRECVSPPRMTRVVDRLQLLGLVQREPDREDGRKVLVSATAQGADRAARLRGHRHTWLRARLRELPSKDQVTLAIATRLLDELLVQDAR